MRGFMRGLMERLMDFLSPENFCGWDIWVEWEDRKLSDKVLETYRSDVANSEFWLFGRLHVIMSNHKAHEELLKSQKKTFKQRLKNKPKRFFRQRLRGL